MVLLIPVLITVSSLVTELFSVVGSLPSEGVSATACLPVEITVNIGLYCFCLWIKRPGINQLTPHLHFSTEH